MNIGSRLMLAGTAVSLLSGTLWVALIPHLIWQYCLLFGATSIFGSALFVVSDPDTPEMKERRKAEEEELAKLEERLRIKLENDRKEAQKKVLTKPIDDLSAACLKIVDPRVNRKMRAIIKNARHISDYATEHDLTDKLIVWNTVYLANITKLIVEYNSIYTIEHPSRSMTAKISEFEDEIVEKISNKVERQYEDLLAGRVNSFDIDLTLVKEISEN